jgi:aspartyl-tRNA(Asn)/glutamyl-tRNA(Gln) amidotransferase subunit C
MAEKITREVFDKMVELAALELSDEEAEYLRRELNNQLTAVEELAAIPLGDGVLPAAHGVPYMDETSPKIREDKHDPFKNPQEILAQAPDSQDGYFVVPDIPHEDLS